MSFIDKFLDLTAPLPREIVRLLKLYKVVEERCRDINTNLKNERESYLQKIREKEIKNNELSTLKSSIEKKFKESLTLSDYKQEILKELEYIFEYSFINKIAPIIEEGQKECQEQLLSNNLNGTYGTNSLTNPYTNKISSDDIITNSEFNDKKKKNDINFLGNKKKRPNSFKNKKRIPGTSEYPEEITQNLQEGDKEKQEVYCKCKRPSFGKMIECEDCEEWFHYECVVIKEVSEPKDWYCEKCIEKKEKKSEKPKKRKKIHN